MNASPTQSVGTLLSHIILYSVQCCALYLTDSELRCACLACPGGGGSDLATQDRWKMDYVNAHNIDSFRGCAVVYGHLKFTNYTLEGSVSFLWSNLRDTAHYFYLIDDLAMSC